MGAKHTPGPWHISEYSLAERPAVIGARGIFAAGATLPIVEAAWGATLAESDANARLIATAPELVEALRQAVEVLDADGIVYGDSPYEALDVLQVARALLARIEGQE